MSRRLSRNSLRDTRLFEPEGAKRIAPDGSHTLVLRLGCLDVGEASLDGEEFDGKRILRCCEEQDGSGDEGGEE